MKTVSNNSSAQVPPREAPNRSANVTEHVQESRATAAGDLASLAAELKVLAHHDLQRLQPAGPAVGRPARTRAGHRQAAGIPRARPGGPLAAHPQGRRGRADDHRTAQLFVQRSGSAGLRCRPCRVVRGSGPGPAAGGDRAEPQRQRRVGGRARGGCRRVRGVLRRPTTTRTCRWCSSGICRWWSSTSPRTSRHVPGLHRRPGHAASSPNTLSGLAIGTSAC